MTTTLIYQHHPSGEKFAIRVNSQDKIIDAAGPLYDGDIPGFLADDWDGDPDVTEEFQLPESLADYRDVTGDARDNAGV